MLLIAYCQELQRKIVIRSVTMQSLMVTKKQCAHFPIFPDMQLDVLHRRTTVSRCINNKYNTHIYIKLQGIDGIILKPGRPPHGSRVEVSLKVNVFICKPWRRMDERSSSSTHS
jgi:hypothetical protein